MQRSGRALILSFTLGIAGCATPHASIPAAVVKLIVRSRLAEIRMCYAEVLRRGQSIQGRLAMRFIVEANGMVSSKDIVGTEVLDEEFQACVLASLDGISFPPPQERMTLIYQLPLAPDEPAWPAERDPTLPRGFTNL